ncbi:MAG: type II secretion system protein [Candidatus Omnitrophica bacterium]|nr:type II secretion system protein [Candidatus Omnitrophota bacterium]
MSKKSVTLLELLIAMVLLGVVVLTFASIENFGRFHTINASKRAKVQNEVTFTLEHIGKNMRRAVGDINNPPIQRLADGVRIRIDANTPATPGIFTDDVFFDYRLSANTLNFSCIPAGDPRCPSDEALSGKIVSGVSFFLSPNPASGLSLNIVDPGPNGGSGLEIILLGRYDPASAASVDNPQVMLKSRFHTYSTAFK